MDIAELWDEFGRDLPEIYRRYRNRISSVEVSTKPDSTLLSEADLAVQEYLVSRIFAHQPGAAIVAEEAGVERAGSFASDVWVIDPIDGTREFVSPSGSEFCSVICLLQNAVPVACFVFAPEIGPGGTGVTVQINHDQGPILVNGKPCSPPPPTEPAVPSKAASVTRESGSPARSWESKLIERGIRPKLRTTSQTLDLVRTAIDVSSVTEARLEPFSFFYRERQKIWDGVAGMALARAVGHRIVDSASRELLPVSLDLSVPEPTFESTLVGPASTVAQVLDDMASSARCT